jgi:hypothetical protein
MANQPTNQGLYQMLNAQSNMSDAQISMAEAQHIMTDVMKNMVKHMMESAEDDIPLSSLKIPKKKKRTIKPIIEPIIETKYDIVDIIDENDENDEIVEIDDIDDVVKVKSMTSDVFYNINLTKNTCECLDFIHRSKVKPEHKCKHLKKYFENMSDVNDN